MSKLIRVALVLTALSALTATTAFAAGPVEKSDTAFVCPVLGGQAGMDHGQSSGGPITELPTGNYTVGGPDVSVPLHATNGDGAGSPAGPQSSPGDTDYTAIWSGQ